MTYNIWNIPYSPQHVSNCLDSQIPIFTRIYSSLIHHIIDPDSNISFEDYCYDFSKYLENKDFCDKWKQSLFDHESYAFRFYHNIF